LIERSHDTAILLFAHNAHVEAKSKQFSANQNHTSNQKIASLLLENTLQVAQSTQLPIFHSHTELQEGSTFGERLSNAFEQIFQKGFQNIIAIGSDTPQLAQSDILEAYRALQSGQQVLGPSKDGGLYLIGLSKENFNAKKFQNIRWQSGQDFSLLKTILEELDCQVKLLRSLADVDHFSSLQFLLRKRFLKQAFAKQLLCWVNQSKQSVLRAYSLIVFTQFIHTHRSLRAPPISR